MPPAVDTPASKPRNKLRKPLKLRPGSTISSSASPRISSESPRNSGACHGLRSPRSPRQTLPLPPDLSDSKWLEYIRQSGYLVPMEKSPRLESTRLPPSSTNSSNNNIISVPDFAQLSVESPARSPARSPVRSPVRSPRRSPERPTPSSQSSESASSSTLRRQAKTPVFRIKQLEGHGEAKRADRMSSVELIADQYKALLEARSARDLRAGAPAEGEGGKHNAAETRQASVDAIRGAILRRSPAQPSSPPPPPPVPQISKTDYEPPEGSPTSDGTLVAFEEDAIYFKPVSYSPEALSPALEGGDSSNSSSSSNHNNNNTNNHDYLPSHPLCDLPSPPPNPDVLSLQIAMDLLTRELSSAVSNESLRAPADVRSLQMWVMIEAYEKLRDQVLGADVGMPAEEVRALEGVFDMWLRALHRVHDRFRDRGPSDVEVEAMQTEELD